MPQIPDPSQLPPHHYQQQQQHKPAMWQRIIHMVLISYLILLNYVLIDLLIGVNCYEINSDIGDNWVKI